MAKSSEVAVRPDQQVVPDFMRASVGKGTENWTSDDFEMPRLKLLQAISPELEQFDGMKAGEFFHTITEMSLGNQLNITPIYVDKRYVLWCPRPPVDAGGILARADDGVHWQPPHGEFQVKIDRQGNTVTWKLAETVAKSGLAEWGTYNPQDPKSPPAATECVVIVVYIEEYPELSPVALMLQRSALPVAKKFRGKLKFSQLPMFGSKYLLTSKLDESTAGKFHNYSFQANGFINDETLFKSLERMHENFAAAGVQVRDLAGADDDDMGAGSSAANAAAAAEKRF